MSPLEFLAAVLPSSGRYCAFEAQKKRHVFVDSLDELIKACAKLNAVEGANTYFWMSATDDQTAKTRSAGIARCVRALWLDLDIGKSKENTSYDTKSLAAKAFEDFMEKTGLKAFGQPCVTSSGNGYHVYWPLDADEPISVWKPIAENFKLLCEQEGLIIDMTCTADAGRVMRMPGTVNYGKPGTAPEKYTNAKILIEATNTFKIAEIGEFIRSKLTVKPFEQKKQEAEILSLPGTRPTATPSSIKLFENSETHFKEILNHTKKGIGCGQLAYYIENASDDGMEPIWRGMLSIAQKCADGDKAARWLSGLHPYDTERMETKLREIKGPYPCLKLDSENPGICTKCSHFGKITNPLALGRKIIVDTAPKEVVLAEPVEESLPPVTVQRPTPPKGFSYGKTAGVFREVKTNDAEGNEITSQSMVLPYSLFVVDILKHDDEHVIHMVAERPEGPCEVTLPQRAIVSKDDTTKNLAQQNIIASYGAGNDKHLFDYVRACVEEASASKRAILVPDHYAWQPNGTFVFNERIYAKGLSPQHVPMRGLANINKACTPKGTIENWRRVVKMLSAKKSYDILALSLVGFGSSLMAFTGFHGITFHLGSSQSGTGKTLALDLAASVWGDPTKYKVGKSTSDVAMQQRLGMLHGLPLITDEITAKNRKDFEWVAAFIFDMSEGKGKERMESGSNKERENTTYWSAMSLLSSNTHVVDYLTGARSHSSEGELRRVLEMKLTKVLALEDGDEEIIKGLSTNHGVAGHMYITYLVNNMETVRRVVDETSRMLKKEFAFSSDERFWHAGCTCLIAGGVLAGSQYAGIVDYPLESIMSVLRAMVVEARSTIKSNVRTAEDVLNTYIRENYGKFVVVKALENSLAASLGDAGVIDQSLTKSEIFGRVEHGVTAGHVDFYIEEQLLKKYCSSMSFGYSDFKKQMEDTYSVSYSKKDLMAKTKGPQMRVNAMCISRRMSGDEVPQDQLPLAAA